MLKKNRNAARNYFEEEAKEPTGSEEWSPTGKTDCMNPELQQKCDEY